MEEAQLLNLISKAQSGDVVAMETLLQSFKPKVMAIAREYFLVGADNEDLIQEGQIGLFKAINMYDANKNHSFGAFASLCVHRSLQNAVKNANRLKNSPLNSYVPISQFDDKNDDEDALKLVIVDDDSDIEQNFIATELKTVMVSKVKDLLTEEQFVLLKMFLNGQSYAVMASKLNKTAKEVDNALQAIKRKLVTLKSVLE